MPIMIRMFWRALNGAVRALFGTVTGLLLVATLTLNLAMVTVPAVFNAVSGLVWSTVSLVSSATATRRATQAVPTAALSADADERARARARLDEAERNNRRLTDERDRATTRAARTQAELDSTRTRLASADTDLDATRARAADAERNNRRLAAERDAAATRAARARTEVDASRARLASAEIDLDATRARVTLLDAEHRETRTRLATVETDNTRLRTSLASSESQLNTLAAQRAHARTEARAITARMQARSLRMVGRNTGSTMVEAVPVIGGTVVLATLAWDIYDTCQQLGDLHELHSALAIEDGSQADMESRWCGLSIEDILARLAGGATPAERACAAARVRTQSVNPPECAEFPVSLPEFTDPLESAPPAPVPLPIYSYD